MGHPSLDFFIVFQALIKYFQAANFLLANNRVENIITENMDTK